MPLLQQILLFIYIAAQYVAIFGIRAVPEVHRLLLDDDGKAFYPQPTPLKILQPLTDDKFLTVLSKINKKPQKYVKHTPVVGKLKSDEIKKCCGNQWTLKDLVVPFEDLIRPVYLPQVVLPTAQIHGYRNYEDIKPVTEHIEDDLKYDFRTKTHSI